MYFQLMQSYMVVNWCSISFLFVFHSDLRKFSADVLDHDRVHDDAKATKKDAALHLALSRISSEFDRESTSSLKQFFRTRRVPVIPTGSLKLDAALGIGGLPKVSCLIMFVAVIIVVVVVVGLGVCLLL